MIRFLGKEISFETLKAMDRFDINCVFNQGRPLLHCALMDGCRRSFQVAIDRYADLDLLDADGYAPLHLAAANGHTWAIKGLIEHGANVYIVDRSGWTPLHHAAWTNVHCVKLLAPHDDRTYINRPTPDGATALHCAARMGHAESITCLFERGADVNCKDEQGWTPLHYATMEGHVDCIEALIACGADPNQHDRQMRGPLFLAVIWQRTLVASILINSGASMTDRDNYGITPLQCAATASREDFVKIFADSMYNREWKRLLETAVVLQPFDLPVLVSYNIYCALYLYADHMVPIGEAWNVLKAFKRPPIK